MTDDQHHLYFSRREHEARAAAQRTTDSCARNAHLRMADAYGKLASPPYTMTARAAPRAVLPAGDALFARPIEKGVPVLSPPLVPRGAH